MLSQIGQTIQDSPTIALAQQARALKAQGTAIIDLGTGHLDYEPPQTLMQAMHDALETNNIAKYIPVAGLPALREQIALYATNFYGQAIHQNNIIITNGAKTGIYEILLTLVNPGEEVIVIAPYWPSYIEQIKLVGAIPIIVQSDRDCHIDIQAVQQAVTDKTKLIITNSPNNPSGAVYSKNEWQTLLDTIRGTDIFLLSDEMYKDFVYHTNYVSPLMLTDDIMRKQIIVLDGLSKNIAIPGWRVGRIIADQTIIDAVSKIQSNMTGNSNSLVQYGLVEFFVNNNWSYVDKMQQKLYNTNAAITSLLDKNNISHSRPEGGLYFFIAVDGDSAVFCSRLLNDYYVSAIPGVYFGREGYVRICYGMDQEYVVQGVTKIIACLGLSG